MDFSKMDLLELIRYGLRCPTSYAGGGKATPLPGVPGWKGYRVEIPERKFVLADEYWVNGEKSGGFTCAWVDDKVRMYMSYQGEYDERVGSFLRGAIAAGLALSGFLGFRGPATYRPDVLGLHYYNNMDSRLNKPAAFRSQEEICDGPRMSSATLGYHICQGNVIL